MSYQFLHFVQIVCFLIVCSFHFLFDAIILQRKNVIENVRKNARIANVNVKKTWSVRRIVNEGVEVEVVIEKVRLR